VRDKINYRTFAIEEDTNHNFFIGTVNGIYYYNTHHEKLSHLQLQNVNNNIVNRVLLINNKIYAATGNGLVVIQWPKEFNPNVILQTETFLPDPLHKRTLQDNIVNTIHYNKGSSSLWVGTNGALYEFDLNKQTFQYIPSNFQNSIRGIAAYQSNILASSWDGGIFAVNTALHRMENDSFINEVNKILGHKRTMSAVWDNENRLWVATFGNGLYIFEKNKSGLTYTNYRNSLGNRKTSNPISLITYFLIIQGLHG
jgi:ligand-binding sensor domain-containing protein